MNAAAKRCAIYTRKSSEEGLDQEFNSLDAQREAGEAYVKSQSSEGWRVLPAHYDDGGFSGGSMERPGLKRLLADIAAGMIDVVVVYKIDRLTRSLADFARIVELFDKHQVSFVSVTQAFNTTSSMGRLTLNVLLSFAQFEREVTGERIRDKIAASKAKGMWMGGVPPLGYDLPADSARRLIINEAEAAIVRSIFHKYLQLGSVHSLQHLLREQGVRSKQRTTKGGKLVGGEPFSRGALFYLLRNRIYLGLIVHKDTAYPGVHTAIVDAELFDAVQSKLNANAREHGANRVTRSPLRGRVFDAAGNPMSPAFSHGQSGKLYRYYVSAPLQQGATHKPRNEQLRRIPASNLERLVTTIATRLVPSQRSQPLTVPTRIEVHAHSLQLLLPIRLLPEVRASLADDEQVERVDEDPSSLRVIVPIRMKMRGGRAWTTGAARQEARHDRAMIKALRAAHTMARTDKDGMPRLESSPGSPYLRRLARLAFLAPDIQEAIMEGRQPPTLMLEQLTRAKIPASWEEQRRLFAFPCAGV
ncbi:recombinase family protein [Sphingosinicella rhizophila]|uniref:Recombinase family protein n=1 Tax=Sphingosinicella rhizophila TaxID=3050082 RepID=A0ABU3QCD4_9SPHN|nr:recombinase family protein [Sphingosinicella sp. GR2756]MDT9601076.1 recombinase family protein [Sphingosinicella sp. GR2756]